MTKLGEVYSREEFDAGSLEKAVQDRYTQVAERGAAASGCCTDEVGSGCCGENAPSAAVADNLYESADL